MAGTVRQERRDVGRGRQGGERQRGGDDVEQGGDGLHAMMEAGGNQAMVQLNERGGRRRRRRRRDDKPARLHLHIDVDTKNFGLDDLAGGNVGHAWVALEWKDTDAVPRDLPQPHGSLLRNPGKFADPMGFWPDKANVWARANEGRVGEGEGYSANPFASYVPGHVRNPDRSHEGKEKATQSWDVTEQQARRVIDYAFSKTGSKYSVYWYNCTTFSKEAIAAAGQSPPSMATGGICFPNAAYDGLKKRSKKKEKKGHEVELASDGFFAKPKAKKPSRPRNVSSQDKADLEEQVDSDFTMSDVYFQQHADALYEKAPDYFVELVAHKIAKHYEDDDKRPFWITRVPEAAFTAAMAQLYPNDTDPDVTMGALDNAVAKRETRRVTYHYAQEPDRVFERFWSRILTPHSRPVWLPAMVEDLPIRAIRRAIEVGNVELVGALMLNLDNVEMDDVRELAAINPRFFVRHILRPLKSNNLLIRWLKDVDLRRQLEETAGGTWRNFVANTPQLMVTELVEEEVGAREAEANADREEGQDFAHLDATAIVDEIFDAFVNNRGIDVTYFTNALDQDRIILSGGTDQDRRQRQQKLDRQIADRARQPGSPATQCHNLLAVFRHLVETYPGLDVEYRSEHVEKMLLTRPLSSLGTNGLLSNFGGNVVDDAGKLTGQVLFTGDDLGNQSHTWSVINGKAYDPVLGTSGEAVAASIDREFRWIDIGRVAQSGDLWIVKLPPEKQAPSNAHGFGSLYRLTRHDPTNGPLWEAPRERGEGPRNGFVLGGDRGQRE